MAAPPHSHNRGQGHWGQRLSGELHFSYLCPSKSEGAGAGVGELCPVKLFMPQSFSKFAGKVKLDKLNHPSLRKTKTKAP